MKIILYGGPEITEQGHELHLDTQQTSLASKLIVPQLFLGLS